MSERCMSVTSRLRGWLFTAVAAPFILTSCSEPASPRSGLQTLPVSTRESNWPSLTMTGPMWAAQEGAVTVAATASVSGNYVIEWNVCIVSPWGADPDVVCNPGATWGFADADTTDSFGSWTEQMSSSYPEIRFKAKLWSADYSVLYDEKVHSVMGPLYSQPAGPPPSAATPSGFTWAQCMSAGADWDNDGILDRCEYEIAHTFRPRLQFRRNELGAQREPYWSVREHPHEPNMFRVFYALAYYNDWGPIAHPGDSEFIVLDVAVVPGYNRWRIVRAYLSAHFGKGIGDRSDWYGADALNYASPFLQYVRPVILVAGGKHANYGSKGSCLASQDLCRPFGAQDDVEVLESANLGNRFSKPGVVWLESCQASRGGWGIYRPGAECFWERTLNFSGWSGDTWGAGSYYESLYTFRM